MRRLRHLVAHIERQRVRGIDRAATRPERSRQPQHALGARQGERVAARRAGRPAPGEHAQRIAGDGLGRVGRPARRERFGPHQAGRVELLPGAARVPVLRGVDLVHARVHRHPHAQRLGGVAARVFGHRQQGVDRQHRPAEAERQPLRHRTRGAQTGEGAGATAEGDRVERAHADARGGEQRLNRREQRRRGERTAFGVVRVHPVAHCERDAHPLGGGVEGEQRVHRVAGRAGYRCAGVDRRPERAHDARNRPVEGCWGIIRPV